MDEFEGWSLDRLNAESDKLHQERMKILARATKVAEARKKLLQDENLRQKLGKLKPGEVEQLRARLVVSPNVAEVSARVKR
jgi:hypothetical protein